LNFEITSVLLEALKPYLENSVVDISTKNKDWLNRDYNSDLVTIDANNQVGFEVFENEIIVYYFTEHYHFEDYSSELLEGQDDYIERAKVFLKELFEYEIRHIEYYKGKNLYCEKYFVLYPDGSEDNCIGNTWQSFLKFINPFGKKSVISKSWHFNKSKGVFTTQPEKNPDHNAIEVIDVNENCYIEIFENNKAYTYCIIEMDFDDYTGEYYWAPAIGVVSSGLYDTKEKAVNYAIEAIKNRCNQ